MQHIFVINGYKEAKEWWNEWHQCDLHELSKGPCAVARDCSGKEEEDNESVRGTINFVTIHQCHSTPTQ